MEDISLMIDGKTISCSSETTILDAAEKNGIYIPTLCHHPSLKPFGACRLCLVEDEKTGRLMASCVTPVTSDISIRTNSSRIEKHRRNIVRLMIAEHPESCLVCSKGNRCELRHIATKLGIGETRLYPMPNFKQLEQANPFIIRDLSKCILCGKCIRADHELVVVGAINYNLRGFESRPVTAHETDLGKSTCTFCGTCVSMCPTGALSVKDSRYIGTPERTFPSVCGFCGVGCSLNLGVSYGSIVEVNPSCTPESVNGPTLCVRGHFAHDFLNSTDRLTTPMIRQDEQQNENSMVPASWNQALDLVANRLLSISHENGPQSIAFLGSSKCTNEENYLFQKIARLHIGTNNVDNGGYVSGQSILKKIDKRTDGGCRINPLTHIESAETIFVLGADPNHSLPVVSYYIKRALKQDIPLIVADPRQTELSKIATVRLPLKPKSDLELLNSLCLLLYENNWYDRSFVDRYTDNFSIFHLGLSTFDMASACRRTGLNDDDIKSAAELLRNGKIAFVIGNGILQQQDGIFAIDAILNLALMTGSIGNRGGGFYLLAGENNQIGAIDMGTVPDGLPNRELLQDNSVRNTWERNWKTKLSPDPGLNMYRMIEAAEKGRLKALYVMGENPLRSLPQHERVLNALKRLDFIVVQDVLGTETTDIADVVLPGACFSEKDGSYTNLEGRIQTVESAVSPPGDAKPDWEILDLLAEKMGNSEPYSSVEKIRSEIRRHVPMYADMRDKKQCWISENSKKAVFNAENSEDLITFTPVVSSEEDPWEESYPFTAILGSLRYHLKSGTRTNYSERISGFNLSGEIEMSPEDADELDLKDGDIIHVVSRHGAIQRAISLKKDMEKGQLFVPLAFKDNDAMNLIGLEDLSEPGTGWKTCTVKLVKD